MGGLSIFPDTGLNEIYHGLGREGGREGSCLRLPPRWPGVLFFVAGVLSRSSSPGHLDTPSVFLGERQPGQRSLPKLGCQGVQ